MKKHRKSNGRGIIVILVLLVALVAGLSFTAWRKHVREEEAARLAAATPTPTAVPTPTPTPTVDPSLFTDPDSLLLLANKKHKLPEGYAPDDLVTPDIIITNAEATMRREAAEALNQMVKAAEEDGVTLEISSAYRSEEYQANLYNYYVSQYGVEVSDTMSSRPGYSDHQTGLAADFVEGDGSMDGINFEEAFEDTDSGKWLAVHAHEYGFIMRYPKGKDAITGYTYEPWHFRYVGKDWAGKIYAVSPDESFEEYFGVEGGDYAD